MAVAPPQPWGGYRTEEEYHRALAEASRAPKVTTSARDTVREPTPAPQQASRATSDDERERARALAEAARAPKVLPTDRLSRKVAAVEAPAPVTPSRPTRAEAERRAQEVLRDETQRVATAKQRRNQDSRIASDKRSKQKVASSVRARRLAQVEEGSAAPRQSVKRAAGSGSGLPPRRKRERPIAECPAAGRRSASLPGVYIVRPGDTLRKIAQNHYNDPNRARAILRLNRSRISDPDDLATCQRIRLPSA